MANDSLIKPKCSCFSTLIFRMILYVWRLFINWIFKIRWYILLCLVLYYSRIYGFWKINCNKCTERKSIISPNSSYKSILHCHHLFRMHTILYSNANKKQKNRNNKKPKNKNNNNNNNPPPQKKTTQYSNSLPLIRNIFQW